MSIGALMVGMALLMILVAYVVRPFRIAARGSDPEEAIEFWIARIREEQAGDPKGSEPTGPGAYPNNINYCPACGRRVRSDDRFCSGCGARLRGGEA